MRYSGSTYKFMVVCAFSLHLHVGGIVLQAAMTFELFSTKVEFGLVVC